MTVRITFLKPTDTRLKKVKHTRINVAFFKPASVHYKKVKHIGVYFYIKKNPKYNVSIFFIEYFLEGYYLFENFCF